MMDEGRNASNAVDPPYGNSSNHGTPLKTPRNTLKVIDAFAEYVKGDIEISAATINRLSTFFFVTATTLSHQ